MVVVGGLGVLGGLLVAARVRGGAARLLGGCAARQGPWWAADERRRAWFLRGLGAHNGRGKGTSNNEEKLHMNLAGVQ
jgi:hypothetical protein